MSRRVRTLTLAFVIIAASPLVASARNLFHTHYSGCGHDSTPPPPPPPTSSVPELDPNTAAGALALLIGGALLLRERRRSIAR